MMPTEMVLALVITAAAGLMRGFAGVGSGMLMAPFFVHLFGPVATVAIIILIEAVVTVQLIFQLPTFLAAIAAPIWMSVRRDSPRQMTMLPGGGSLARAR